MGLYAPQMQKKSKGAQGQNTISTGVSAPLKGLVANNPIYADIKVDDAAIILYNLIPRELGCSVRPGSLEFATNILDKTGQPGEVRTIMYYNSVTPAGSIDRMFVATDAGIFDVTAGGAGPHTLALAWPATSDTAGWCSYVNYTNVAGDHYLLVCDEANGYYQYDGTSWTQGTITGATPNVEDLVHIVEWSGRLWFTERNSATAYYLDVLDLGGALEPFNVGSRFKKGGYLVQCATWTVDDGEGLNDRLVMASAGGDILVWDGDPDITTDPLKLLGRWYVGPLVEGRRAMANWGGDTVILSSDGIARITDLMSGAISKTGFNYYVTSNISRYFREEMLTKRTSFGWEMMFAADEGFVVISIPTIVDSVAPIQFVVNLNTSTWCIFRDLDMVTMNDTPIGFVFGTRKGRLMKLSGTADEVLLTGPSSQPIEFSLLTHFTSMNRSGVWKRPHFIRPAWVGDSQPSYEVQVRFDFDLTEIDSSPAFVAASGAAIWDADLWDTARWEGTAQSFAETRGIRGMGRHLAIALRGVTETRLALVGFDIMGDMGGQL